jgi:hypothetical protein
MTNELSHALFAGAVMAAVNPLLGLEVIGWNVFLAGIVGMLLNLDRVEVAGGMRSPIGHSVGFCLIWVYVVGIVTYVYCVITGAPLILMGAITLAVGIGLFTHLLLDALSGRHIFTIPNNTRLGSWFSKTDTGSDRFWGAWSRARVEWIQVRDSQVNVFSLVVFLLVIAVF